jgi:tetratricopeptide (TPR) repeat protein
MKRVQSSADLIGKISTYLQIVSKDSHSTAFVPLAEAYRQLGLLGDALEAARMGTAMLPHFCPGFTTLGRILAQMGRIDEALIAYTKALDIDLQSQSALVGLARLHLVRGERELARNVLHQAAAFHPDDELIANMLVAIDMPSPWQHHKAAPPGEASPAVAPATAEPVVSIPIPTATLAEIYAKQGLTDQAAHVYEEILRSEPDNRAVARRLAELRGFPPLPAVAAAPSAETVSAPPAKRQLLETFEGWLRAVQVRRAHVQ